MPFVGDSKRDNSYYERVADLFVLTQLTGGAAAAALARKPPDCAELQIGLASAILAVVALALNTTIEYNLSINYDGAHNAVSYFIITLRPYQWKEGKAIRFPSFCQ